jgi:hypothetical protein
MSDDGISGYITGALMIVAGAFTQNWWMVASGVVSLAGTAISQATAEDPISDLLDNEQMGGGIRQNTRSTQQFHRIIYGKQLIGGNDVFIESTGTDNKDLWIVQNLAEGECAEIYEEDSTDQIFLDDKLPSKYGGNVSYWFHSGSSTQTYDTNLNSAIARWTENKRYTCYLVWKLTYDQDYFQSVPKRTVILKGLKVTDFRDSPETVGWSDNPVLCLYDFMTNDRYGMGIDSSKIDTTSFTDAANYCDTKSFTLNATFTGNMHAMQILDTICNHFRGQLVWWDGKFYLRYADLNYESSNMTLNDVHVVRDEKGKPQLSISQPSTFQRPDGIRVKFLDPDKDWVADDLLIGDEVGVIKEFKLVGCNNREMAANLGTYQLERWQLDRTITGTFRDDTQQLEPHDVVTANFDDFGISSQLMRVTEAEIMPGGLVNLTLQYEASSLYDDDYNLDTEGVYICSLPDPTDEPPPVANADITEEVIDYRLRSFTRLKITFDEPTDYPWFDYVEIWQSFDNATWKQIGTAKDDFNLDNVEEGQAYYLRLKTVSIFGTKTQDSNDRRLQKTVSGKSSAPTSLSNLRAVVNANTINLYDDKVSDSDIELYEFRLGDSWSGAIFLAALRSPNLSLYGVKPGSHTFWASTLANNGEYGGTPVTASATLKDPPDGWTVQHTETEDYTGSPNPGTFDNTEQTTYDGESYLKCSHGGSPVSLTGTYTSEIYDLGSSGRYLVYLLADIAVTGTGTTWGDQVPSPTTWEDVNADTRTWSEIFELPEGPQVKMKLKYGDTTPPSNEVEKLEVLSAIVTARYYQFEIEIIDPSPEINALVQNYTAKWCQ